MLCSEFGKWIPATVEQDEDDSDVVLVGNLEKLVDAPDEPVRILGPRKIVQENASTVESKALCPSQLAIDGDRIKRVCLPHFQFVDRGAWDEVAADQLGLLFVPVVGLLNGPPLVRGARRRETEGVRSRSTK